MLSENDKEQAFNNLMNGFFDKLFITVIATILLAAAYGLACVLGLN